MIRIKHEQHGFRDCVSEAEAVAHEKLSWKRCEKPKESKPSISPAKVEVSSVENPWDDTVVAPIIAKRRGRPPKVKSDAD